MFLGVPGVKFLHLASWQEWGFAICLMAVHNRHPKIRRCSACSSLGSPHCMSCAQCMWTRWAFAEKSATATSLVMKETEGHPPFPPLSALLRISPPGLIICALKEDKLVGFFIWEGGRPWGVLSGEGSRWRIWSTRAVTSNKAFRKVWLQAHTGPGDDLVLTDVRHINNTGGRQKTKTTP